MKLEEYGYHYFGKWHQWHQWQKKYVWHFNIKPTEWPLLSLMASIKRVLRTECPMLKKYATERNVLLACFHFQNKTSNSFSWQMTTYIHTCVFKVVILTNITFTLQSAQNRIIITELLKITKQIFRDVLDIWQKKFHKFWNIFYNFFFSLLFT